jgi:2-C-methyl-D-erythritol 4-phosphate cytidylyltransferase/2-C-methyl-D-erythritol 2,4-cyclodiphosphate synthase
MHVAAIIAAAGRGIRLGAGVPKQFLDLGDGRAMLERSIEAFAQAESVKEIVVALPPDVTYDHRKFEKPIRSVTGGTRRQDSVANAFAAVSAGADVIVIHDAARPFVTGELIDRTVRAAYEHGAAIAAVPVTDTLKHVAGSRRVISGTIPRDTVVLAQTPQAFRRDILARALALAENTDATDEATLVERAGFPVHVVEGDPSNIKVTTRADLSNARARMSSAGSSTLRIGTGYDLHRLVEGRPLVLAGVLVPFDRGLHGHSDADIICHAVTDAILGAAAAGDIGQLFPDTDPRWKDADSLGLLREAVSVVTETGHAIVNVDVTVVAEQPKLRPHLEQMRANLAEALGIARDAVSIKGKTNEGTGAIGHGEAMACHAVALLIKEVQSSKFKVQS